MADLVLPDESYAVIGCCFEVHNGLGCGFLEAVYQEALEIELLERGVPFESQAEVPLHYKGKRLTKTYKPDLICFGKIIVEIKATSEIADEHRSQVLNYLAATNYPLGLLVNFGSHPKLAYERFLPRPKSS